MNILHIAPYYAPAWAFGGVVAALNGLARAQAEAGHEVAVLTTDALTFDARTPIRRETIDGVEVIRCRNLSHALRARYNLATPLGFRRTLYEVAAASPPDVIHLHEWRTIENLLLDRRLAPIVCSPHGTLGYGAGRAGFKRAWDRLFGRRLAQKMTRLIALTGAEADEVRALWTSFRLPLPEIAIVPNGVAADLPQQIDASSLDLRAQYGLGAGTVILFLGRLHERKGLQFLIPAFARAAPHDPDARLLIAGPDAGYESSARQLAEAEGVSGRGIFAGMLSGADRLAALKAADVFVLPAVGEGLSMAALEAMAGGQALILTPGCNLPEVTTEGAGWLVERTVEGVAGALREALADPNKRRECGNRARAWVRRAFTWEVVAKAMIAAYQN